jgi:hypothetical protein
MLPQDIARNPFFQLQWMPCRNVASANIKPHCACYVVSSDYVDMTSIAGASIRDPHKSCLQVVPLDSQLAAYLSQYSCVFSPQAIVFNGPQMMYGANYGGSKAFSYGTCSVGEVMLAWVGGGSNAFNLKVGQRLGFNASWILSEGSYPRPFTFLGYTRLDKNNGDNDFALIARTNPWSGAIQIAGDHTSLADASTIVPTGGTSTNTETPAWLMSAASGVVTCNYAGYYSCGFQFRAEDTGSWSWSTATFEGHVRHTPYGGGASNTNIASKVYLSSRVMYPLISATGLIKIGAGDTLHVRYYGPTAHIRNYTFWVKYEG